MLQAHHDFKHFKLPDNQVMVWPGFEEARGLKEWMKKEVHEGGAGLDGYGMNYKMAEEFFLDPEKKLYHKLRNNEVMVYIGFKEALPLKKWMEEEAGLDGMDYTMAEHVVFDVKKDELKNLLKSENQKVIFCDEFKDPYSENPGDPDLTSLSELAGKKGSDIVVCLPKEPEFSNRKPDNVVLLPLSNPHRQGYQPYMLAQYLMNRSPKTVLPGMHQGRPTLWLNFDKKATARKMMEEVKKQLRKMMKKEKEQLVIGQEESRTGMVICSYDKEEVRGTLPARWTVEDASSIFGAEAQVTVAHV